MEHLPRKLLVGLSFTDDPLDPDFGIVEADESVLDQAIWYASKVGGSLHLVYVTEGGDYTLPGYAKTLHDIVRDRAEPILREIAARAREAGVSTDFELLDGDKAWYTICALAKARGDELVVVGPRREHQPWLDRLVHGSTARRLIRKCPVPLWIAHPREKVSIDKVLVPTEFKPIASQLSHIADLLHEGLGAERYMLHCAQYPGLISANRDPDPETAVAEYRHSVLEKVSERFDELLGHDEREAWHTLISDDPVDDAIPTVAGVETIDLVVMGTIGRKGLTGFVMGNTAERVLAHLNTPVWVVKPDGWVSPFD